MRTGIWLTLLISICFFEKAISQTQANKSAADSLFFNYAYWNGVADKQHLSKEERSELLEGQKKLLQNEHDHQHLLEKDLIWVSENAPTNSKLGSGQINAGPCTNIDFESGNMSGWVRSTGYNPLTNTLGCCPNPNGDQTIMTGGTDPYGGFPTVFPGGGSFSLRLGSTAVGGIADRISQTFFVTAANANFTYRYALVLNDGGHALAQQPRFTSEIIDTLGNPVPCTFYQASAGTNTFGLLSSTLGAPGNNSPVSYKNWTNVALDLTPNIGQNVTLRFTVYDCGPSGHFAYAYIDGSCTNFATSVADTTCPNIPITMCAPSGFSTTTWNGPGVTNNPNQCITVSTPGTYTCTTVLIPGCPGPTFTHTLTALPAPLLSFTPVSLGACSTQYTFNSTSSISSGSIVSYRWSFGDGGTASTPNATHTYAGPGTYLVKLKAISSRGCADSIINPVTVFPFPNISFSPPSNCINTVVQFTNTSTISVGSITGYTWTLGNGPTSNLINPTNSYSANGTYTITLKAVSNQGCQSTLTQTLGIFPPPIISFTASPLCDINGTSFSPSTSTAIASGSLATFLWNFGDGGTSTAANPVHIYSSPGIYTVSFSAVSNHNCPATTSNVFSISPSPTVAFATTSINACTQNFTFTNNSAIASGPITYTWSFGGTNTTTSAASSISYTFPGIGNYTVRLIGSSNMGCTDTAYQYVSIYPYPVINFSVPASCENAIFTVSTTAVSGSVTSYNWNFGDPASGSANTSTLQNPTHFYSTTNNYSITLNIMSNLNCPSSTVVPITVFPNPSAAFSFSTLNNCSLPFGFVNSSSVSTIGASSITANNWSFGSAGSSALANPGTVNFPGSGTYSVNLIVTTNHNCKDTASNVITVYPLPQINYTLNPTCQNVPVIIPATNSIATTPGPSSINSFTWNYGDGNFSGQATPPPHSYTASGNYVVSFGATSNMGCVVTQTQNLVIHPSPIVNFTNSTNFCFGNTITFSATATVPSPGSIFAYSWDFGDGTLGSNPNTSHTYSTVNAFPVTFSATSNNECLSVITKTVTIYPLPVVSFSVNGGCLNIQSQFSSTASILSGVVSSYSWNLGNGGSATGQNLPYTYTVPGVYTPTLIATSNLGCNTSISNSLVIHPLPVLSFSAPNVCENLSVQFANTSSISLGTISSYTWSLGNGLTSNSITPAYTYTSSGVKVVTLSANSNQGCLTTGTTAVSIYPYPTSTLTTINSSCINDLVSFNPNISIVSGSVPSTTINFGDGSVNTYTTPVSLAIAHSYTAYNTYTVIINANSNNNCARTFTSSVIIYPKPFVNFTSTSFCRGDSTFFTNTSIIPTGSISNHYWFFGDGSSTSTLKDPKHKFTSPTIYSVSLTEFSYPEPGLTCSLTAIKLVTINPLPVPVFTSSNTCAGLPTLFGNTTNTTGIIGWTWDFTNDGTPDNSQQNPSFVYPAAGNYTAALIAKNSFNCTDTVRGPVVVYANPTPSFSANNGCLGTITNFTNYSTPGSGTSLSYNWSVGGSTISNVQNPSYTFGAHGSYSVELTTVSNLGCSKKYGAALSIYELPNVNFVNNTACLNAPTSFTNISGISTGSISKWRWDYDDNGIWDDSLNYHGTITYPTPGKFNCKLQLMSNNGCVNALTNSVIVRGIPTADFAKNFSLCVNTPIAFTNLSTAGEGTISAYSWDFNTDGFTDSDLKNASYTFSINGVQNVKLSVSNQFGCSSSKTGSVYINPKAKVAFTSDKQAGCPNLCVNFSDQSSISTGTIRASVWNFGDGSPNEKNIKNPGHCYQSGNYGVSLTITSDSGCVSSLFYPGYINAYSKPVAAFDVNPPEIDENEPIAEITSRVQDAAFTKFFVSDGVSYTGTAFTHTFKKLDGKTKPMIVQIVSNKSGCWDTLHTLINIKPAFVVYIPNVFTPNGDGLNDTFQTKGVGISKFAMQIFDRWGKMVYSTKDINAPWDGYTMSGDEMTKEDVYVWKAEITDVFNKLHIMTGHVTVLR